MERGIREGEVLIYNPSFVFVFIIFLLQFQLKFINIKFYIIRFETGRFSKKRKV